MNISKVRLLDEAGNTDFRPDILEKVIRLLDLLTQISEDAYLEKRLVLKGGTALNLFIFDVPRLSVDIDLNYIGSIDREKMLAEKPVLEGLLKGICERSGFNVRRQPEDYAGGKWILNYTSAMGGGGNLELDLNYLFRVNFCPVMKRNSKKVGSYQAKQISVLDTKELTAGKLAALLTRTASRDLFDAAKLLKIQDLADEEQRLVFVLYGALHSRANWCEISPENIKVDQKDVLGKLVPVLKVSRTAKKDSTKYGQDLLDQCKKLIAPLFPLRSNERDFVTLLREKGIIKPELLTHDIELIEKIKVHPSILWRASQAGK